MHTRNPIANKETNLIEARDVQVFEFFCEHNLEFFLTPTRPMYAQGT